MKIEKNPGGRNRRGTRGLGLGRRRLVASGRRGPSTAGTRPRRPQVGETTYSFARAVLDEDKEVRQDVLEKELRLQTGITYKDLYDPKHPVTYDAPAAPADLTLAGK